MQHLDIVTSLHTQTKRDYIGRMNDVKPECMQKAREYNFDYWDGERRFGYGGYRYMLDRWKPVAEALINRYKLTNQSSVLDVGCGKGFLLHEMKKLLPDLTITGFDISHYGLEHAKEEVKTFLFQHKAQDTYPYQEDEFDLVFSLGCLHNLKIYELVSALNEMQRVGKQQYTMVESYRSVLELFNLQCWALTAEAFFDKEEWLWIFKHANYSGDYEFIYFE